MCFVGKKNVKCVFYLRNYDSMRDIYKATVAYLACFFGSRQILKRETNRLG